MLHFRVAHIRNFCLQKTCIVFFFFYGTIDITGEWNELLLFGGWNELLLFLGMNTRNTRDMYIRICEAGIRI